ncbi:helix-turn-helix domain-containing protein [Zongyangia hominis]|uniref:Helix-turn-helix transcriptional regulator n=1 Tax=Zongyangia hominis TaxID=2763677 RepID=A0A926ICH0_9FIRM|nr:helix-turn-helix transcriptional regulator [Zongyangia hominis]MBC8571353.1 helix-turn-helix transcriptional regulator [Zongyangia hominis]
MISPNDIPSHLLMGRTDTHIYLRPHPALRGLIAHYTLIFPGSPGQAGESLTLIPDASGCLIFILRPDRVEGLIWGATTQAAVVHNDFATCPPRVFVEFLPGTLSLFAHLPQEELSDRRLPLSAVSAALTPEVARIAEESSSTGAFIAGLDALLLKIIEGRERPAAVLHGLKRLRETDGMLSISALAQETGYSARHLSRLFGEYVGMSAKTFARVLRVNLILSRMREGADSLTLTAQEAGFYDQSHFIRDFSRICGAAPTDYLQNLSDFYNETFKF